MEDTAAGLSPLKRKREPDNEQQDEKRARLDPPVPDRIVVLHGFWNDTDDYPAIVKYWDPDLCLDPDLGARIAEKLKKPRKNRGFVHYLLSGNDAGEEDIDEAFLARTPEELGVRAFAKKIVSVDLDF